MIEFPRERRQTCATAEHKRLQDPNATELKAKCMMMLEKEWQKLPLVVFSCSNIQPQISKLQIIQAPSSKPIPPKLKRMEA